MNLWLQVVQVYGFFCLEFTVYIERIGSESLTDSTLDSLMTFTPLLWLIECSLGSLFVALAFGVLFRATWLKHGFSLIRFGAVGSERSWLVVH